MEKRQPAEIPGLCRLHGSLPLDGLKRAFVNLFPVGNQHDPKRVLWNPDFFTDPIWLRDLRTRQDWTGKPVPSHRFLVHMSDDPAKILWLNPVAELAKYSGSSLTLMSNTKPYAYTTGNKIQGVIFRVPANNMVRTTRICWETLPPVASQTSTILLQIEVSH